jgi:chaperone required for assembly of F1-ATPase
MSHSAYAPKGPTIQRPKRFYKSVTTEPRDAGFCVLLDGRLPKTPAKKSLIFSSAALAQCVADEWSAQASHILPETMPITRLVNIALDRAEETRGAMVDEVVKYAGTDLVCYRAPSPESLVSAQSAAWDGVLDWVGQTHGVRLHTTTHALAIAQPPASLQAVRAYASRLDDYALTALTFATGVSGSAVLAIALVDGWMDGDTAFKAIRVEEDWQAQRWGADPDEVSRAQVRRRDLVAVRALMAALAA